MLGSGNESIKSIRKRISLYGKPARQIIQIRKPSGRSSPQSGLDLKLICSPSAIQPPAVFSAEILNPSAAWVTNYTRTIPAKFNYNHGDVDLHNAEFCNITVTYTHPGHDDRITVETWLPRHGWNGRLQATGGGGWQAGRFVLSQFFMSGVIGEGYATTTTDAGLGDAVFPNAWALKSPGNVDYGCPAQSWIALVERPSGHRQEPGPQLLRTGARLLLLEWLLSGRATWVDASAATKFVSAVYYPLLMREWRGIILLACESNFLPAEAIAHCDPKDGVVDRIISNMIACDHSPYTFVNQNFHCPALNRTNALSEGAAIIGDAAWSGPRTKDGKFLWYGVNPGSDISSYGSVPGQNSTQVDVWFNLFVAKNASFETSKMTRAEYERAFHLASQEYTDFMNAAVPDLSEFRKAGGKLITYHGLFYRFFEAPGLRHCSGGVGGQPITTLDALRLWGENGTAPETLPVQYAGFNGTKQSRILCSYPAQTKYMGGDASSAESFRCV
ncbi:feruloyl esterase [Aspergillus uvarum CBS 121591]|uniref:Carboxylic ester hydrolase n=1 Tax=Aspergillus uvarum CBS 121591 TaxID=1448315 RepID=A0A319CQ10_9EURO|nr:feruloyl esterase [Aspergillus uvarum CBS 121591]PYH77588.1 feruloyl esterase [Aspergillus uvarum CBS 121591]